ncbi:MULTISPECIES: YdaS family helix-turn-helix protein [unclassified Pseudomonas]|uniref:transcriptional regulator n=1 Tax=unclassified Pseudomonas TaxID=196821 RepID=UPI00244B5E83|nr:MULTISPECIES: YdaS family helix-turn-helix protein [unclassified Pseudomonas]MDG9928511.1 helix-turn-helix domain-containing protein [Pseudomonas sp. GD04042]MDH0482681.1 helix-turn-helix domain-containing protein [Pseudomonas sp. GD04015]MDH0604617.1 helix-turn-helix domain-containing protein [Pseudomonas sp. GD03869]
MNLHSYIKPLSKEDLEAFSARCDTTSGQIKQVAYGRRPSAELAIKIEIASGGRVTCEQLRPDVNWGYLRGTARMDGGQEAAA